MCIALLVCFYMVIMKNTMKTDIRDYILTYKGWYNKQFCESTVKEIDSFEFERHKYLTLSGEVLSYDNDLEVSFSDPKYPAPP
mgnify:CR=1 FL=1